MKKNLISFVFLISTFVYCDYSYYDSADEIVAELKSIQADLVPGVKMLSKFLANSLSGIKYKVQFGLFGSEDESKDFYRYINIKLGRDGLDQMKKALEIISKNVRRSDELTVFIKNILDQNLGLESGSGINHAPISADELIKKLRA